MRVVDPLTVIESVLESVKPALDAKEIRLETILDGDATPLLGDEARLQQILWNLVSNAAKFTPRRGKIRIVLRRVDSMIEISVEDSGQGIKEEFLPYVFDRFRQADGGISRVHGGLGLGLAIARHLVELHGGSIAVASGGEGKGRGIHRAPSSFCRPPVDRRKRRRGAGQRRVALGAPKRESQGRPRDDRRGRRRFARAPDEHPYPVRRTREGDELGHRGADVLRGGGASRARVGHRNVDHGWVCSDPPRAELENAAARVPALALTAYARSEDRRRALLEGFQMHLAKPWIQRSSRWRWRASRATRRSPGSSSFALWRNSGDVARFTVRYPSRRVLVTNVGGILRALGSPCAEPRAHGA